MSVIAMQTVIARICVDSGFRQVFVCNPDEALESWDLTDAESAAVRAIDLEAITAYADSLVGKKMALVTKWFPLSIRALRKGLPLELMRRIVYGYGYETVRDGSDIGGEWVRSEFVRFRDHLRRMIATGEIPLPHFADLLEFEATRQMMSQDPSMSRTRDAQGPNRFTAFAEASSRESRPRLARHVQLRQFGCDIVALVAQVEETTTSGAPVPAESMSALFIKKAGTSKIIVQAINQPLREVLELCDGTRTVDEVVASMVTRHAGARGLSAADVRDDCAAVLEQFCSTGIVELDRVPAQQ